MAEQKSCTGAEEVGETGERETGDGERTRTPHSALELNVYELLDGKAGTDGLFVGRFR